MPSLTKHLLSLQTTPTYDSAIHHPFLISAGNGTLSSRLLALWLSQDRIYAAHAYPAFIGSLIASIPWNSSDGLSSREEQRNKDTLSILVFSLENVVREVDFFKDTASQWNLPLEGWKERKGTKNYTAEMARISKNGNIEDGLVFLWAMEQVYLDAWSFVAEQLRSNGGNKTASPVHSFAQNWSSPEFFDFVDKIAKTVDDLNIQPGSDAWKRAEAIWVRTLELEVDFWPEKGEENI